MIQLPSRSFVLGTLVFLASVWALLFVRLLPLSAGIMGWPGPDWRWRYPGWVLRRPDQLAAPVIVLAILVEDVLLMRPLGLWTAIVLLGPRPHVCESPVGAISHSWLKVRVGVLIGLMMLGYRLVQVVFVLQVPALGLVILQFLATVAAYPLVVFGATWLIGLRRLAAAIRHEDKGMKSPNARSWTAPARSPGAG